MCGKDSIIYPKKLSLNGEDLPFVKHANHLGHELNQMCNMNQDISMKKARLIDDSTEIRECFSFADPALVLKAIRTYAGHYYGSMLWDLNSDLCGQYCRVWNTAVKLVHNVPRSCHTYLVQHVLAPQFLPTKVELMSRFVKFFKSLKQSASFEVCLLAKIAYADARSTTRKNLILIENETGLDPLNVSPCEVKNAFVPCQVPRNQEWRLNLLIDFLNERREIDACLKNTEIITHMIDSLCYS